MKSRILHISQLTASHACENDADLFRETFGEQVAVTVARARKFGITFNFHWAADNLLSVSAQTKCGTKNAALLAKHSTDLKALRAKYRAKNSPLLAKHKINQRAMRAQCDIGLASRWAALDAERAAHWAKFWLEYDALCAKYESDRAALWADYYINDEAQQ